MKRPGRFKYFALFLLFAAAAVYMHYQRVAPVNGMGMMGGMMRGGGMGGMMDGMSSMSKWLNGETLPVDLDSPRPPENENTIKEGKRVYELRCIACHGVKGDAKGERAGELATKPRDFRYAVFKFRSTPTGALPTNDDIYKTISRGVQGTAMLPWFGLSSTEKWLTVYYIKTFSGFFDDFFDDNEKPDIVKAPRAAKTEKEYVRLGADVYKKAKCFECHGVEGLGDGMKSGKLKDDWGEPISPRNLREDIPKRGLGIEDLYLTIATGLNGTPMPSYSSSLTEDEILSLSFYIRSIAPKPGSGRRGSGMGMMGVMMSAPPDVRAGMMIDHVMMPTGMGPGMMRQ